MTTSFGLACPSTAGANSGVPRTPSEALASFVKLRRVRLLIVPSSWSGYEKIGGQCFDLVILQSSGDVLHHGVVDPLLPIGLDHLYERALRHPVNVGNRAH